MRWRNRLTGLLLTLPLLACAPPESPTRDAFAALDEARRLDAALDSAADPDAGAAQREAALATARDRFDALAAADPDLPEAHLGRGELAWLADRDLATAEAEVQQAITLLEAVPAADRQQVRAGGRTANQLLAEAYAHRASFLISRHTSPATTPTAPPTLPAEPWARARDDVARALALDPQPQYELLQASLSRLRPSDAPLSPGQLTPRAAP